eukprot:jgi/Mesvir1/26179/Mv24097-RA.1
MEQMLKLMTQSAVAPGAANPTAGNGSIAGVAARGIRLGSPTASEGGSRYFLHGGRSRVNSSDRRGICATTNSNVYASCDKGQVPVSAGLDGSHRPDGTIRLPDDVTVDAVQGVYFYRQVPGLEHPAHLEIITQLEPLRPAPVRPLVTNDDPDVRVTPDLPHLEDFTRLPRIMWVYTENGNRHRVRDFRYMPRSGEQLFEVLYPPEMDTLTSPKIFMDTFPEKSDTARQLGEDHCKPAASSTLRMDTCCHHVL